MILKFKNFLFNICFNFSASDLLNFIRYFQSLIQGDKSSPIWVYKYSVLNYVSRSKD